MYKTEHLDILIAERIRSEGVISFREFMDMALYYPGLGYYTSSGEKIGISGDYMTSPTLTCIFGELIARQVEEMWTSMNERDLTIVEYGAGNGTLCNDILNALKRNEKLYRGLRYCIIEKSPAMREREFVRLGQHEKVSWYERISEIEMEAGCVITNEVLDNFPVHKVIMENELMEVCVTKEGKSYMETLRPAHDGLKAYFDQLSIQLPKGFCAEVNLDAQDWMEEIGTTLKQGYVITIDYGYPSAELYSETHREGTLKCYYRQSAHDDPYRHPGEQDITAHVNFSALSRWGKQNGLECCGFTEQSQFLRALGVTDHLRRIEDQKGTGIGEKEIALLHSFMVDMGSKFKVLIQGKNTDASPLTGLLFGKKIN